MRNKFLFGLASILIIVPPIIFWVNDVNANKTLNSDLLTVKVSSDKQSYIQGETVKLTFEFLNETDKAISFYPNVNTGYLKVWIAFKTQRFNRYNAFWGLDESGGITLQPGRSVKSEAAILWNNKLDFTNLNIDSILQSDEGAILSHYAFQEAGNYSIKAVLTMPVEPNYKIESAPITIIVNEPVGDDLKVWNIIKDNKAIAYFTQKRSLLTRKTEEREKLLKEIERIVNEYPNSILSDQMKQSLEKFRVEDERRKASLRKVKID